jgi:uridine phosphorylase
MMKLSEADLIINPDGSIYHLNLRPEDIAETVITVGDLDRVPEVSKHFDSIEVKKGKREFITHTGYLGKKRISVISTGIGTDNIDIVFNELDALVNIDFESRMVKEQLTSLDIIRIGTSGAIQADIPMGTILASAYGLGFDALMLYYQQEPSANERQLLAEINSHFKAIEGLKPYVTEANERLLQQFAYDMPKGITATAPGFYAPQGRRVRAKNNITDFIGQLNSFERLESLDSAERFKNYAANQNRITNLEMETAGIYALAKALGHKALSINAILASRVKFEFSSNPEKIVEKAIKTVLERI